MTIKGLTDRPVSFPEIGSIRKGDKGGTNGAPRDLSYFLIQLDERETKAAEVISRTYKDQPTEINILFPFDDVDRNFECWMEAYTAGALVYRSDGERVLYEINPTTGERLVVNGEPEKPHRPNPIGRYTNSKGNTEPINAKPTGRMKVILPELARLCYLTVHTTSVHDVMNLTAQLRALYAIHGRLAGIPLKLRRRPVSISTPTPDGKRARRKKWLLSVEADPEWVAAKIAEMQRAALPGGHEAALLLSAPGELPITHSPTTPWPESTFSAVEDDDDDVSEGDYQEAPASPRYSAAASSTPEPETTPPPTKKAHVDTNGLRAAISKLTKPGLAKDLITNGNGPTVFWTAATVFKIEQSTAKAIASECANDWPRALLALNDHVIPF